MTLNSYPGVMNNLVSPSWILKAADDSRALRLVVPTAITLPPVNLVCLMSSWVSVGIENHSLCILCSDKSSVLTGVNVPAPT